MSSTLTVGLLNRLIVMLIASVVSCGISRAQVIAMDQLRDWVPSGGTCSYGPYTAPTGNVSCSLSGSCYNNRQLNVSASEIWRCGDCGTNTVQGGAYLIYKLVNGTSYPAGEYAWAQATPSWNQVTYPSDAEQECDGFSAFSGNIFYRC